jgi:tRNA1Val (adenine37-N6)-methyltransferase
MTSSERSSEIVFENIDLDDVSLDRIYSADIKIFQKKSGYRFNSDSVVLSWFIHRVLKKKKIKNALEIGSGSGIIPIILNKRGFRSTVECVEIQKDLYELLKKNIEINGLTESLVPVNADFRELINIRKEKVDLVFTNPPYFGINDGKINPESEKAIAKHEFSGSLTNFISLSKKILNPGGHFIFVYPLSRIHHALGGKNTEDFVLNDICFFRENELSTHKSFCAHFVYKGLAALANTDLITIRDNSGNYSKTGEEIMYEQKRE